jgi:hypothetical protein
MPYRKYTLVEVKAAKPNLNKGFSVIISPEMHIAFHSWESFTRLIEGFELECKRKWL